MLEVDRMEIQKNQKVSWKYKTFRNNIPISFKHNPSSPHTQYNLSTTFNSELRDTLCPAKYKCLSLKDRWQQMCRNGSFMNVTATYLFSRFLSLMHKENWGYYSRLVHSMQDYVSLGPIFFSFSCLNLTLRLKGHKTLFMNYKDVTLIYDNHEL